MVVPKKSIIEKFCTACLQFNHTEANYRELARTRSFIAVSDSSESETALNCSVAY